MNDHNRSTMILPLNQALAKRMHETVTVRVMQVEVKELIRTPSFMMAVIVADQSRACKLIMYNAKYEERVANADQHGLLIVNAINKESHLVTASTTIISIVPKFTIPPAVLRSIKGTHITVQAATSSPEGKLVSVQGKVSKINVSPCRRECHRRIESFAEVTLKDDTGAVNLALWGTVAENVQKGQVLSLKNVRVRLFQNEKNLSTTPTTAVEVINNEALSQLSEDDDTEEDSSKAGTILGLIEVEPYSSCPMSQCKNAKLKTEEKDGKYLLRCHKHGQIVTDEAAQLYMYARFHVQTRDGKICTLVAFLPILKLLFEAKSKKFNLTLDKHIIERDINSLLPFPLRFLERNGIIEGVCFKRAASHLDT